MYSSLIRKHSCIFYVKHNKNLLLLASYFWSYLIFEKNNCIPDLLTILVCDMCYHARKINSFPCNGQFNKSGNFSTSQGTFNCFKEGRGRWHIPAYSPKLNMFHWPNIVSRNSTTSRCRPTILYFTFTINSCNKVAEKMAVMQTLSCCSLLNK